MREVVVLAGNEGLQRYSGNETAAEDTTLQGALEWFWYRFIAPITKNELTYLPVMS